MTVLNSGLLITSQKLIDVIQLINTAWVENVEEINLKLLDAVIIDSKDYSEQRNNLYATTKENKSLQLFPKNCKMIFKRQEKLPDKTWFTAIYRKN